MRTDSCELCGRVERERRVHLAEMDAYHEKFAREHRHLRQEYLNIEELLRDVVWYNFETVARTWKEPWPQVRESANIELYAQRHMVEVDSRGRERERASFPHYYKGAVSRAPALPPEIVLIELKRAWDAVKRAEENCAAPYEWAPGGRLYQALCRESEGARAYMHLSSKRRADDGHRETRKDWAGLQLGDPVARQTQEGTEATAHDILG